VCRELGMVFVTAPIVLQIRNFRVAILEHRMVIIASSMVLNLRVANGGITKANLW
jgi:hypothetical protein